MLTNSLRRPLGPVNTTGKEVRSTMKVGVLRQAARHRDPFRVFLIAGVLKTGKVEGQIRMRSLLQANLRGSPGAFGVRARRRIAQRLSLKHISRLKSNSVNGP